jgi:hypothetical protein
MMKKLSQIFTMTVLALCISSGALWALEISSWDRIFKRDISHLITLKVDEGIIFDDFYLTNRSSRSTGSAEVELIVLGANGDRMSITAHWNGWWNGETKKISESTVYDIRSVRVKIKTENDYADMEYRR